MRFHIGRLGRINLALFLLVALCCAAFVPRSDAGATYINRQSLQQDRLYGSAVPTNDMVLKAEYAYAGNHLVTAHATVSAQTAGCVVSTTLGVFNSTNPGAVTYLGKSSQTTIPAANQVMPLDMTFSGSLPYLGAKTYVGLFVTGSCTGIQVVASSFYSPTTPTATWIGITASPFTPPGGSTLGSDYALDGSYDYVLSYTAPTVATDLSLNAHAVVGDALVGCAFEGNLRITNSGTITTVAAAQTTTAGAGKLGEMNFSYNGVVPANARVDLVIYGYNCSYGGNTKVKANASQSGSSVSGAYTGATYIAVTRIN